MPNYKIISSASDPLVVLNNQPYTDAAKNGQVYDITTGDVTVSGSGYLAAQLTIPANQNITVYILRLIGGSTVSTTFEIYRNAAFTGGTSITPANNNWDYSGGSVCTAKYINQLADPTSGGTLLISVTQAGGGVLLPFDGRIIIPSSTVDRQFYLLLKNKTTTTNVCSISLAYWEV
ncbi:MAG: hypothetical protein CVU90_05330 [Firmicutes bacterium HGW-Firmicutes-15]|nr:MAG: hypothetical protein CVU90_05330 [Firmicutes bacterium HGW-Firmicutes-15]